MAEVKVTIQGFRPVLDAIHNAGLRVEQKHMDSAMRQGLTVIARKQRQLAPVLGAGNRGLKRAIGSRVFKNKVKGIKDAKVGIAVGKKVSRIKPQDRTGRRGVGISARNAHWFILGTKDRVTKSGRKTGRMRPIAGADFIKRAFSSSQEAAANKIISVLWTKAREELKKR